MKRITLMFVVLLGLSQVLIAQTPDQIKSSLPVVDGWKISEKVEVFTPDNLYNRINGSAPLFLENNFREMTALEYTRGEDYITIQVYRHASPEDTFGMYASERSSELKFFPIGAEAQGDDTNIYFFADNLYVKIWESASGNVGDVMRTIAAGLAKSIAPVPAYPAVIRAFPSEGKVPYSEAYITSNYIGHEFLKGVYTGNYQKDGQKFQAFVWAGKDVDDVRGVLSKYFTFTKQPQEFNEGVLLIKDRYNGDIPVLWQGRYLAGIYSEEGNVVTGSELFLKELMKALE